MSKKMAELFRTISSGVYVVGVAHAEHRNAFTAAWIAQVSYKPLMLSLSVNPNNASYQLIKAGQAFAVNVLEEAQMDVVRHFGLHSGCERDKLAGHAWRTGITGAPIFTDALAYFDCRVHFTRRTGDHVLVIGQVLDGAILKPGATPMTYAQTGDLDGGQALYPTAFYDTPAVLIRHFWRSHHLRSLFTQIQSYRRLLAGCLNWDPTTCMHPP
jgi:flavin reductase (DIM6/NTAB) family NADH-FMN oxidoreductase RutF